VNRVIAIIVSGYDHITRGIGAANNVAEFKQSQFLTQTVQELVNRSVRLSRQIKGIYTKV